MITRTPIIDDDGSGTTGTVLDNAWKQELYNQIDGALGPLAATQGNWTPVDGSGAGLVFSSVVGKWARIGNTITIWGQLTYPATSNGAAASIGGLPFPNGGGIGAAFWIAYLPLPTVCHVNVGTAAGLLLHGVSGAARTNAELANLYCLFSGTYLAA